MKRVKDTFLNEFEWLEKQNQIGLNLWSVATFAMKIFQETSCSAVEYVVIVTHEA